MKTDVLWAWLLQLFLIETNWIQEHFPETVSLFLNPISEPVFMYLNVVVGNFLNTFFSLILLSVI